MTDDTSQTYRWKFNHVSIRVSDLDKSLFFYEVVLGMKRMTLLPFDDLTIVLLGYVADSDGEALLAREGVLELVHSKHSKPYATNAIRHPELGLAKLCFAVPNLEACMTRIKEYNVHIVKEPGSIEGEEEIAKALGASLSNHVICSRKLHESLQAVGFVEDPDGYLLELVQF
ncbi:hypothetical protein HRR83_001895 [Exophiala dermatitidis]|uniref:Lactoylglutathione lyase n=2 Tax=Exophiala dermatitidis TaxID=5970 RepID=H6C7L6_EXODN|nr:lactoylglutathione lyase [Exophiala dermatitidis NIH/UT8656]KAJ4516561.1 hypothetical protein HRR73_005026 [Exophiala dermatitidis]EHY58846.1 lactoylglutathione lyase [Exophiala dermatitidis NIH/UT8656]KAJ4523349.1 hypothetical protein HRR75_001750 [Exophiala dermatitidis]KAJ4526698.1 hypothetical protein HRR74_001898 [Exophiala dermatitidis]KAJ4532049.1 hypothetical protein HRR76_007052 [Exophiala dermatitidis]